MASAELPKAAERGDVKVVKRLLASGVPPNSKGGHGWSSLHFAAQNGHAAAVDVLLKAKAIVDAKSPRGETPLHLAAAAGHAPVVNLLVAGGASVKSTTPRGLSPLHLAIQNDRAEAITALLAAGASVDARGPDGLAPLFLAITHDRGAAVRALVAGGAALSSRTPDGGLTPLELAAQRGQACAVAALLECGARVGERDTCGDTALHRLVAGWVSDKSAMGRPGGAAAAEQQARLADQYTRTAEVLLAAGADPWVVNQAGKTPLMLAADRGLATARLQQLFIHARGCPRAEVNISQEAPAPVPVEGPAIPGTDASSAVAAMAVKEEEGEKEGEKEGETAAGGEAATTLHSTPAAEQPLPAAPKEAPAKAVAPMLSSSSRAAAATATGERPKVAPTPLRTPAALRDRPGLRSVAERSAALSPTARGGSAVHAAAKPTPASVVTSPTRSSSSSSTALRTAAAPTSSAAAARRTTAASSLAKPQSPPRKLGILAQGERSKDASGSAQPQLLEEHAGRLSKLEGAVDELRQKQDELAGLMREILQAMRALQHPQPAEQETACV